MAELKNSNVRRSGVSVNYWNKEDTKIFGDISNGLRFRFNMASKGGGKTDVMLTIEPEDLRPLIIGIAEECPQLADTLADATHRAVKKLGK